MSNMERLAVYLKVLHAIATVDIMYSEYQHQLKPMCLYALNWCGNCWKAFQGARKNPYKWRGFQFGRF